MTQTYCFLGNKAALWEPPGQQAAGEGRPVGTWRWAVWVGGILLGEAETPHGGWNEGLLGS